MASSKEIQQHSSRPLGQHRLSVSTNSGSLPRQVHSRNHSHSVSSGSLIPSHRVTRRKSVSSNASNVAVALAAAVREAGDTSLAMPIASRRGTMSKGTSARSAALGSLPSPPASLPSSRLKMRVGAKVDESAIDDDQIDDMEDEGEENEFSSLRIRRASEGQHLMKDGKKANSNDLKCDKCGKGYKHSSCLTKHLWEHTPEWSLTSKLLISKHQQVQLLEAASVLVTMNQDGTTHTPPDSAKDFQSDDQDSASPTSGSDERDGFSSADTTPPPDMFNTYGSSYSGRTKRYSSGHGFSRSYQSGPSNPLYAGSMPSNFGHYRQASQESRPLSSGMNRNQEDDGLAAALDILSCSFGSNTGKFRQQPANNAFNGSEPDDVPPVPSIPAEYLSSYSHPRQTESYTRHQIRVDEDVKMEESEDSVVDDEDYDQRSRGRSDEDDEGVFGRMEE